MWGLQNRRNTLGNHCFKYKEMILEKYKSIVIIKESSFVTWWMVILAQKNLKQINTAKQKHLKDKIKHLTTTCKMARIGTAVRASNKKICPIKKISKQFKQSSIVFKTFTPKKQWPLKRRISKSVWRDFKIMTKKLSNKRRQVWFLTLKACSVTQFSRKSPKRKNLLPFQER